MSASISKATEDNAKTIKLESISFSSGIGAMEAARGRGSFRAWQRGYRLEEEWCFGGVVEEVMKKGLELLIKRFRDCKRRKKRETKKGKLAKVYIESQNQVSWTPLTMCHTCNCINRYFISDLAKYLSLLYIYLYRQLLVVKAVNSNGIDSM